MSFSALVVVNNYKNPKGMVNADVYKRQVQVYYEAKGEELDPAYADLSHPTKPVKEVWLEQVARCV